MNPGAIQRYRELRDYVGWTDEDALRVAGVATLVDPFLPALIVDFYDEIARHPDAQKVITGGPAQVTRLKETLLRWIKELFSGRYDDDYVARRWRVGYRHVEIGLDQVYTNAALARLRRGLGKVLDTCLTDDLPRLLTVGQSLNTLIDLDLAIIDDAYQSEFAKRQQQIERLAAINEAQERVLQSERLAAIGQMMAGLAHESRNALQRSQACLEMLAIEIHDRPAALNLVARIQKAQDDLYQLYEEVRDYAAPLRLTRARHDLRAVLERTWENLGALRSSRDARLECVSDGSPACCCVDAFALEQVFRNILENALAACSDPVRIRAEFQERRLDDEPGGDSQVSISIADNGPGLSAEAREKIFEPFFTTKTKGTGLGMAISRRIVEAHGGEIAVGREQPGAEIVITLPRK